MFSTYAVPLILGEIKRYIRDNTSVRISRGIKDNAYMIMKFKEDFIKNNQREATIDDIKNSLNLSEYDIKLALNSLKDVMSIYDPIYNDSGDTIYLCDQIADNKIKEKDSLIALRKALEKLRDREKSIIEDRYYLGMTQSEIANSLNISQAQVSRIEKSALVKLRKLVD